MSKLLPCPFCGGEAEICDLRFGLYTHIGCKSCSCKIFVKGERKAIKAWNSRYEPPTPHGAVVPAGNEMLGR